MGPRAGFAPARSGCTLAPARAPNSASIPRGTPLAPPPPVFASIATLLLALAPPTTIAAPTCEHKAAVYRGGRTIGERCPDELRAASLTAIDLGDTWAPYPFDGAAIAAGVAPPSYRDTFIALADQRFGGDTLAAKDHDLELYGITPSPRVVLAAMDDTARHSCHDAIDDDPLRAVQVPLRREDPSDAQARRKTQARRLAYIAAVIAKRGLADPAELAAQSPAYARLVAAAERDTIRLGAIAALQAHLVCDGLLQRASGIVDGATRQALASYQRRHWIVAHGELDADTRDAMIAGSRELDFRLALRLLRQRVADAAGLIEDGSARNAWGTVLGRQLDPADLRYEGDDPPLANGAPDSISPATEAAARALGWLDFATTRDGLRTILTADAHTVAVALPPPLAYHSRTLPLRAVIDRHDADERATLTLYAQTGDGELALVRWPTTVGGWKPEKLANGWVVKKKKPSDTGPRVWRDLVVAPVWFAPDGTPDDDLVGSRDGHWAVKEDLIGPGYRSAYGLVMLIHHQPVILRDGTHMLDHGIRTHGSVSYRSILVGDSHGCHRLYNHHVLRLANFLLRNHSYVVHGAAEEHYVRRVRRHGQRWVIRRDERGFRYELTPPVPIEVGRGVLD